MFAGTVSTDSFLPVKGATYPMEKSSDPVRDHRHGVERRDLSPAGRARRAAFDRSLQVLRELGFEDSTVEFYRQAARTTGLLPHEVVRDLAEGAARSLTVLHRALRRSDRAAPWPTTGQRRSKNGGRRKAFTFRGAQGSRRKARGTRLHPV
jgi:hypothetical protein